MYFFFQANVMLEYNLDDAEALLVKNLDAATKSLESVDEDLGFIRDQTTTTEVSIFFKMSQNVKLIYMYCLYTQKLMLSLKGGLGDSLARPWIQNL